MPRRPRLPALAAALLTLAPGVALADAIDGDWCQGARQHMTIKGPDIVTPGGSKIQGNYSRHAFSYVVPKPEAEAGSIVLMILLNENTTEVRTGADQTKAMQAAAVVWHRCDASTSMLRRPERLARD